MANVKLASKAVGSIVKLKVGGVAKEFIVVHKGLPSSIYDASCGGVWLLMKDIYKGHQWHSSDVNKLESSTIHSYLNGDFLNLIDDKVKSAIKQVKLPYRKNGGSGGTDQSGVNGLSAKIFLLSGYEVGFTTSDDQYFPVDGAKLDYFTASSGGKSKRIAYYNGSATNWWLRSPDTGDTLNAWYVYSNGDYRSSSNASISYGIRPALILPYSMEVDDSGNVVTSTRNMRLCDYPVGSTVKMKVNNVDTEFLVVNQGVPGGNYDASCSGTWLLMKNSYESRALHSSDVNKYESSTIHSYLNGDFLGLFDDKVKSAIKQVKIPYRSGGGTGGSDKTGSDGLECKVFLLSGYEVGWTTSYNSGFSVDGACLSYFAGTDITDAKRICYKNGSVSNWWLRSVYTGNTTYMWRVTQDGYYNRNKASVPSGIRPALIMPFGMETDSDDNVLPTQSKMTVGDVPVGGVVKMNVNG